MKQNLVTNWRWNMKVSDLLGSRFCRSSKGRNKGQGAQEAGTSLSWDMVGVPVICGSTVKESNTVTQDNDHFNVQLYVAHLLLICGLCWRLGMTQMIGTGRAGRAGATSKMSFLLLFLAPQWRRLEGWPQPRLVQCLHVPFTWQPRGSDFSPGGSLCQQTVGFNDLALEV